MEPLSPSGSPDSLDLRWDLGRALPDFNLSASHLPPAPFLAFTVHVTNSQPPPRLPWLLVPSPGTPIAAPKGAAEG